MAPSASHFLWYRPRRPCPAFAGIRVLQTVHRGRVRCAAARANWVAHPRVHRLHEKNYTQVKALLAKCLADCVHVGLFTT